MYQIDEIGRNKEHSKLQTVPIKQMNAKPKEEETTMKVWFVTTRLYDDQHPGRPRQRRNLFEAAPTTPEHFTLFTPLQDDQVRKCGCK